MKIWVVGGDSGIGGAIADGLVEEGHNVLATGKEVDVRADWSLREFFTMHHQANDPINKVVFSAGINYLEWIGKASAFNQFEVVHVNLMGFINLMEVLVANTSTTMPLDVLAISSDAAERPLRTSIAYCASKAGLDQAVRVAARELGPSGWRVNALSPGMVAGTGMSEYIDRRVPEVRGWHPEDALTYERSQEVVPGRIGVGEVAGVAIGILMSDAPHLNGTIITLNGGR